MNSKRIVVGLTGGIGSGKTTVARMFEELDIPVYIADKEAKMLMITDESIKKEIVSLFGEASYSEDVLNRSYLAKIVFNDKEKLEQLNAIIHPAVTQHFVTWKNQQKSPYVIKEVAILFENGGYKQCDYTILICAPLKDRVQRVLDRDKTTEEEVYSRIKNQWDDKQKIPLADFVIYNTDLEKTRDKVYEIHKKISE